MARQTTYRRRRTSSAQAISPSASPAYRQGLERTSAGVASPSDAIDVRSKCLKNCCDAAVWGTFKHDGSGHREAQWRSTPMWTLAEFTKTTLIGGVLIIL